MKKYYVVRCTNKTSEKESDKKEDRCLFSTFWSSCNKEEAGLVAEELNASIVPAEAEIFGTEFIVFEVDEGSNPTKKSTSKEPEDKKTKKSSEEKGPSKSSVNSTF